MEKEIESWNGRIYLQWPMRHISRHGVGYTFDCSSKSCGEDALCVYKAFQHKKAED